MFKKPSPVQHQNRLSGSDRKKLRARLRERFPAADDTALDHLLPAKGDILVLKLANRSLIYGVDGQVPMWIDTTGKGDLFPTVFALWEVPTLVPAFTLKHSEVSRWVLGGADAMLPGVDIPEGGFQPFREGEVWSVKVPGNPAPIAVGTTALDSQAAASGRGKALRVVHFFPDTLWESAPGKPVPNEGFQHDVVKSLGDEAGPAPESAEGDELHRDATEAPAADPEDAATAAATAGMATLLTAESHAAQDNGKEEAEVEAPSASATVPVEDMDSLLQNCLLLALHKLVKDKDLPIAGGTFWSNYILLARPAGTHVDIKKSSFKKVSKFIQKYEKEGLLAAKEDRKTKEMVVTGVNRKHELFTSFVPDRTETVASQAAAAAAAASESTQSAKLEVHEVYKASPATQPVLEAVGADTSGFYTEKEVSELVFQYIKEKDLTSKSHPSVVTLDVALCDALFKGVIKTKQGETYPTEISKAAVTSKFAARMVAHHAVTRGQDTAVRKGSLPPLQILTEVRQGRKKITRVTGLESYLIDPEAAAADWQHKFACSTTVGLLPGKKAAYEVVIQGGVLEEVAHILVQQHNVPKKHIEILDKTKR
eukprot:jgi/Chlat1/2382/Chrsp17S02649